MSANPTPTPDQPSRDAERAEGGRTHSIGDFDTNGICQRCGIHWWQATAFNCRPSPAHPGQASADTINPDTGLSPRQAAELIGRAANESADTLLSDAYTAGYARGGVTQYLSLSPTLAKAYDTLADWHKPGQAQTPASPARQQGQGEGDDVAEEARALLAEGEDFDEQFTRAELYVVTHRLAAKVVADAETIRDMAERSRDDAHKARQYDSVVEAVEPADGGRYRADTVSALLARVAENARLSASLEAAEGERDRLRKVVSFVADAGKSRVAAMRDGISPQMAALAYVLDVSAALAASASKADQSGDVSTEKQDAEGDSPAAPQDAQAGQRGGGRGE